MNSASDNSPIDTDSSSNALITRSDAPLNLEMPFASDAIVRHA